MALSNGGPSDEYQRLIQEHNAGNPWEDPDFQMHDSIWVKTETGNVQLPLQWKRPSEIQGIPPVFDLQARTVDIDQGYLGDCWFLGPMASLTSHKELFQTIVPPEQTFDAGIFRFHFWVHGGYKEVLVDDRLPCIQEEGGRGFKLVYVHSARGEYWAPLLEKAFAKLHGGYEQIDGNYPGYALEAFTGLFVNPILLQQLRGNNAAQARASEYSKIKQSYEAGALIGAGTKNQAENDPGPDINKLGIVKGHQYSIIAANSFKYLREEAQRTANLVLLRNPWGNETVWKGDWSDEHDENNLWQYVDAGIKSGLPKHEANDGEFWISFDDLTIQFDFLEIVLLNDKDATIFTKTNAFPAVRGHDGLPINRYKKTIISRHANSINAETVDLTNLRDPEPEKPTYKATPDQAALHSKLIQWTTAGKNITTARRQNHNGDGLGIVDAKPYRIVKAVKLLHYYQHSMMVAESPIAAYLILFRKPRGAEGSTWRGRWSENSKEWTYQHVDETEVEKLGLHKLIHDGVGDFWLDIKDLVKEFDILNMN